MDSSLLVPHSRVNLGGSEGIVFSTDPNLTYLVREDGKVDIYTTESVVANGEPVLSEDEAQEAAADQAKDQRIAELEAQVAAQSQSSGGTPSPATSPAGDPSRQQA